MKEMEKNLFEYNNIKKVLYVKIRMLICIKND